MKRIQSINEYKTLFCNKKIINILKKQQSCRILTIKDVCNIDTVIFDTNNEIIEMKNIKYQDNVRLILYLKNIWVMPDKFGINLKVSQIQRLEPLSLCKSLFQNNKLISPTLPPPPPPPPPKIILKKTVLQLKQVKEKDSLLLYQGDENSEQNFVQTAETPRPSLSDIIASKNKLRKTNILC